MALGTTKHPQFLADIVWFDTNTFTKCNLREMPVETEEVYISYKQ